MKYQVLESGKPAVLDNSSIWNNCVFNTFDEAYDYMRKWLGSYAIMIPEKENFVTNLSYSYSGYDDTIKILEIE